jgi:hypothetical protein
MVYTRHIHRVCVAHTWVWVYEYVNKSIRKTVDTDHIGDKFEEYFWWGNPDTSTAPLPMWYTSMRYTPMRYTSTALYFYIERTQVPRQFFN